MIAFCGVLYDGLCATGSPVELRAEGETLVIASRSAEERRVALRDVVPDTPVPGVPRTLMLPGGVEVVTREHAAVVALWPMRPGLARIAFTLESRWRDALASIALIGMLLAAIIAFALPLAAAPVAFSISPEVARFLGDRTLEVLDRVVMKPTALPEDEQLRLRVLFARFAAQEPEEPRYQLLFRRAGVPNALALPGGSIVLTDEMVGLAASDDEILAVLAHEIGHVRQRHALRLLLQQSGVAVLVTALAGDSVGMTFLAAALPAALLHARYSQAFEREADDYAFAHMKEQHVSPQAFADVMRRLAAQAGGQDDDTLIRYLSSHPATAERIRRAEEER